MNILQKLEIHWSMYMYINFIKITKTNFINFSVLALKITGFRYTCTTEFTWHEVREPMLTTHQVNHPHPSLCLMLTLSLKQTWCGWEFQSWKHKNYTCIILQTKFNPCAQKFKEICKNIKIANTLYFILQASPFLLKSLFLSRIYTGSIATGNFREPDYIFSWSKIVVNDGFFTIQSIHPGLACIRCREFYTCKLFINLYFLKGSSLSNDKGFLFHFQNT